MAFDLKAARAAGYSDAEIADFLSEQRNFDAEGARKAGYTDAQIIGQLSMTEKPKQAPKPQGLGAQTDDAIGQFGRQLGLTARYGIEGVTGAAGAFVDPVLRMAGSPTVAGGGVALSDMIGLPNPQGSTERIVGDVSRMAAGAGGIVGAAGKAAQAVSSPAARGALELASSNPASQVAAGAGAGGGAGYMRETGGSNASQLVGAVGGGLLGGVVPGAGMATARGLSGLANKLTPQQLDVKISRAAQSAGVDYSMLPSAVKAAIREDAQKVLQAGGSLDEAALRRLSDYRLVGATPLKGSITQDPALITQQMNAAKAQAAMGDASPTSLPAIQNANMRRLVQNMDDMGAEGAPTREAAGQAAQNVILGKDARAKAIENALYKKAQGESGRTVQLDRAFFTNRADELLREKGKNAFLPASLRSRINEIAYGVKNSKGEQFDVPFDVDAIDTIKTELAAASRASKDGNEKAAIAMVRQALEETPITSDGMPADVAQLAMNAFDKARKFARARRNWQESAAAIKDTLDDVPPDRFIEQYVIGGSNKASAGEVMKLWGELRKGKADGVAKSYVLDYLKRQATRDGAGAAADDATQFSAPGLTKALDAIGDSKLKIIFTPEELQRLKAVRNVAKYETAQTRGSAVNNSNTAATAFAGFLNWVAGSPMLKRIPFAKPGVIDPANNWLVQIQSKGLLDAGGALGSVPKRPLMAPPAAALLAAPGLLSDR